MFILYSTTINRNSFQKGMSYVELIVVLGIFSVLSAITMFNYGEFQAKIDIKNLSSDVAVKIVESQKVSNAGTFPPPDKESLIAGSWKPSYGVHFFNPNIDNKNFIYFVDANNDNQYFDGSDCAGECMEKITIAKNNFVSNLAVFYTGDSNPHNINDLTISFSRTSAAPTFRSSSSFSASVSYFFITMSSPGGTSSGVKIYPSGRIQIN